MAVSYGGHGSRGEPREKTVDVVKVPLPLRRRVRRPLHSRVTHLRGQTRGGGAKITRMRHDGGKQEGRGAVTRRSIDATRTR